MKTHFSNHKKILKDLRARLRKEQNFSALFYFDMYRKSSPIEKKQQLLSGYIDLHADPLVRFNILSYLLRSDFTLKKKHLVSTAKQIAFILYSDFLQVPYSAFIHMVESVMVSKKIAKIKKLSK